MRRIHRKTLKSIRKTSQRIRTSGKTRCFLIIKNIWELGSCEGPCIRRSRRRTEEIFVEDKLDKEHKRVLFSFTKTPWKSILSLQCLISASSSSTFANTRVGLILYSLCFEPEKLWERERERQTKARQSFFFLSILPSHVGVCETLKDSDLRLVLCRALPLFEFGP